MNDRITFNPNQCGGRPCIRGMRIRVKDVLDLLAAGVSEAEILEDFPYLERADFAACLQYAAAEFELRHRLESANLLQDARPARSLCFSMLFRYRGNAEEQPEG